MMKFFWLFTNLFFTSIYCSHITPLPEINEKIVGGKPGGSYDAPYAAALLFDNDHSESFWPTCTGTVIGIRAVLTAAQCTNGTLASQWLVRAGSVYMNVGGQLRFAAVLVQHPDFNEKLQNDISIIITASEFRLQADLIVAALPYDGQIIEEGYMGTISGWGALYEDGVVMARIQVSQIPIIDQKKCVEAYLPNKTVTENMICAGKLEGGIGFCSEDLGGPLEIGETIIGIASWSNGCARPNYPGVWTRVSKYRKWVDSTLSTIIKY